MKEHIDCYMASREQVKLEEYKQIIQQEFILNPNGYPITRFSVCRKAVSDFKKLKPSVDSIAELMVFYMETACRFANEYRDLWLQFCNSVVCNFKLTLSHLVTNNLWDRYEARIKQCLRWISVCGCGFPETLEEIYARKEAQYFELRRKPVDSKCKVTKPKPS